MATDILDLWGDAIKTDILTPLVILKMQAGLLRRKTKGMILGDITVQRNDDIQQIFFDLQAPAVGVARVRVLGASHRVNIVYPVVVEAEPLSTFHDEDVPLPTWFKAESDWSSAKTARTEEAFVEILKCVLQSQQLNSVIQSLIARSNEVTRRQSEVPTDQVDEQIAS